MVCILAEKDNGKFRFPRPTRNTPPINNYLDDCSHKFHRTNATVAIDEKIWEYILPAIIRDIEEIITTNKPIFNMECETGFSDHKIGITKVPTLRASNPSTIVVLMEMVSRLENILHLNHLPTFQEKGQTDWQ